MGNKMKSQVAFDAARDIFQILAVVFGQYYPADTSPVGGDNFFLDSADFQDPTAESNLAGHGQIPAGGGFGQS